MQDVHRLPKAPHGRTGPPDLLFPEVWGGVVRTDSDHPEPGFVVTLALTGPVRAPEQQAVQLWSLFRHQSAVMGGGLQSQGDQVSR
ncbi:hypothetical protein AB0E67_33445 [Streptomyces sp. NPDC032161]|uniref:hypothetical protein n=1 Tax=unclassified Streptomyces TaxID=2593676 RepID=UPI0033DB32FF